MLEVLPSGQVPPNPSEVSASQRLADLLEDLAARADLVLIDAPPILDISDAISLAGRVDALVVVNRISRIKRGVLRELQRVLASVPATTLGFVQTGASPDESYSGYGYDAPPVDLPSGFRATPRS
jgi:polysaccharide biosynthesis transport protein